MKTATSHAAAAKQIRTELKAAFPSTKFSVTSESFSMGNAVRIEYTDGPTSEQVENITNKFQYGSYDSLFFKGLPQVKYVTVTRRMNDSTGAELTEAFSCCASNCSEYENQMHTQRAVYEHFQKADLTVQTVAEYVTAVKAKEAAEYAAWSAGYEVKKAAEANAAVAQPCIASSYQIVKPFKKEETLADQTRKVCAEFNAPYKPAVAINCAHIGDDNDYSCFLNGVCMELCRAGNFEMALKLYNTDPLLNGNITDEELRSMFNDHLKSIEDEKAHYEHMLKIYRD